MSESRSVFLERVRKAVAEGNRVGAAFPLPPRGDVGYQGAGEDLASHFARELTTVGGNIHVATDAEAAAGLVVNLAKSKSARQVLLGRGPVLDRLGLAERLRQTGAAVQMVDELNSANARDTFFAADLGISGVSRAIAETGTLVMATNPNDPRSLSLLPPVHIAVVGKSQLVPDLFDFFVDLEPQKAQLPACLSLITGPSKTGDIELKLVTGVHGPGELHVVLIAGA